MPDWYITKDGDKSCLALYERHYSAYRYADGRQRFQFVGPGAHIVLRTARADALFVWRDYIDDTIPKQEGVECAVFRNEGPITSSKLIRQADAIADVAWPDQRHYTKVNPAAVGSGYPGWCFIRAGWKRCGTTRGGLHIFEREVAMRRLTRGQRVLLDVAVSLGGSIHVFADQRSDVAKLVSCGLMTTAVKIIDQQATITPAGRAALAQSEEKK